MAVTDVFLPKLNRKRFVAAKNKARKDRRGVQQQQQQNSSLNVRKAGIRKRVNRTGVRTQQQNRKG
jgi:hypothetical protein